MSFSRWVTGVVCVQLFMFVASACETDDADSNAEAIIPIDGIEWHTTIASTEETPDLADADVRLLLPSDTAHVRGILVFSRNGVGGWEYEHNAWRSAAVKEGLALMDIDLPDRADRVTPWESADQSAIFLDRMFPILAELSGHPELAQAPLFFFGHSAGAFWFTRLIPLVAARTAGFIAFQGSLTCEELFFPDTLAIPGMFVIAEYDPIWIRTDTTAIVEEGLKNGALWSLTVQPDIGHWDIEPSRPLMISFMQTVFDRRLPQSDTDAQTELRPFPLDDIRLGTLSHRSVYDGNEEFEGSGREIITGAALLPPQTVPDPAISYHRLISSQFAETWLSYEAEGIETGPIL